MFLCMKMIILFRDFFSASFRLSSFIQVLVSNTFLSRHVFSFLPLQQSSSFKFHILYSLMSSSFIYICVILVYCTCIFFTFISWFFYFLLFTVFLEFRNSSFKFSSVSTMQCVVNSCKCWMNKCWWSKQETMILSKLFFSFKIAYDWKQKSTAEAVS